MKTKLLPLILFFPLLSLAQTYTFSILKSFSTKNDPNDPSGLIIDSSGNLYGTSVHSGPGTAGGGTVFSVTPKGVLKVLHRFPSPSGTVAEPQTSLTRDTAGNLYGTAIGGCADGCGTVFKVTPAGKETNLYTFPSGVEPSPFGDASVTLDSAGNLYGYWYNFFMGNGEPGSIFELTPSGSFTTIHDFSGPDGLTPFGSLIMDKAGNFYGTTQSGGEFGFGTIFKMTPQFTESVLYSFGNSVDNVVEPTAKLVQDASGNLYGTANAGTNGGGVVFKLTSAGFESTLYTFCHLTNCSDGQNPAGPLTLDAAGNLYGTTKNGGTNGDGVVFKITPAGAETVLYNATEVGGAGPRVSIDKAGNLYGTTCCSGTSGQGSVYKLTKGH